MRQQFDPVDIVTEVINRADKALDAAVAQGMGRIVSLPPSVAAAAVAWSTAASAALVAGARILADKLTSLSAARWTILISKSTRNLHAETRRHRHRKRGSHAFWALLRQAEGFYRPGAGSHRRARAPSNARGSIPENSITHVFGNAQQTSGDAIYGARHVALRAGLPIETPALTVNRLCAEAASRPSSMRLR